MRQIILMFCLASLFCACEKQGMEDVYADQFPESEYPPLVTSSNGGGTINKTDISSLLSSDINVLIGFSWGTYYDPNTGQPDILFNIERYKLVPQGPYQQRVIIETSSYTYYICTPSIIKIEKLSNLRSSKTNAEWDNDILGYWVAYKVKDKSGKVTGKMVRLDQQKYIDLK